MGTPEPSSLRSVPGAAPGRDLQIHSCDGVDSPENGVKCGGHPKPRLSMEPVRTTSSASRPRSVRSYCFSQPGANPGGGVGSVGSGDGVTTGVALSEGGALPDGDGLSPGDAAAAGVSDDVADGTSDGAADVLSAGDAATLADGASDGAGSFDWFDFAQPADANTKISATTEATTRSVRIWP